MATVQHRTRHGLINVNAVFPPIPRVDFDYSAVRDDDEPPCAVGYGSTAQAALDDLLMILDDMRDFNLPPEG